MVCQPVVLLFLKRLIVKRLFGIHLVSIGTQQIIDKWGVVEDAMDVGSNTTISHQYCLVSIANTLMYLITLTLTTIELKGDLTSRFLFRDSGMDRQAYW